ncbi:MAG: biotin/lipoyl-binding protein, partial [Verrucomicrobia bacterium]|nr:biotin/lipoyl-binding protein [Verrucomicrobiota bacterium]
MTGFQPSDARIQRVKAVSGKPGGRRRSNTIALAAVVCAGFAMLIYAGISSRMEAEKRLEGSVKSGAIPVVTVIHLKARSIAQEIELPGTTEAFTEAPIYARTSGYLQRWFFDIGAHVRRGQLLAEIETPELDQQLQQAEHDLRTAQANLQLAQVTADRWVSLLKKDVVSKQETDQAISDFNAKRA